MEWIVLLPTVLEHLHSGIGREIVLLRRACPKPFVETVPIVELGQARYHVKFHSAQLRRRRRVVRSDLLAVPAPVSIKHHHHQGVGRYESLHILGMQDNHGGPLGLGDPHTQPSWLAALQDLLVQPPSLRCLSVFGVAPHQLQSEVPRIPKSGFHFCSIELSSVDRGDPVELLYGLAGVGCVPPADWSSAADGSDLQVILPGCNVKTQLFPRLVALQLGKEHLRG
mmetsp:Transcript_50511/g.110499  ORF Transcript_50511/g.110499 Transcript_50511/m.110499 type:complete len:225 (-) Transcript_50511:275-949(-)